MRLHPGPDVSAGALQIIEGVAGRLPRLEGGSISISFHPELTAHRGKLLTGGSHRGTEVHAAAFIRQRRIVVESGLLKKPNTLRLILTHEIFHFAWARLGNVPRAEYGTLLQRELAAGAKGELGESAGVKKRSLGPREYWGAQNGQWRDYVCESFCDTAAWLYSGVPRHSEFDLANRWRLRRRAWLLSKFSPPRAC